MIKNICLLAVLVLLNSCTKHKGIADNNSNYPSQVAAILLTKCAITGCHNSASSDAAAGLTLDSWDRLFEGGRGGAAVIPFRPDFSTMCYYTNSYSELGPKLSPTMPINGEALTKTDYMVLRDWIANGARNLAGFTRFKNTRNKLYVTNQLCDMVMVIDGHSKLTMACIDVGVSAKPEFPVCIRVSPNNNAWYVSFLASNVIQKFDTSGDSFVGQLDLGEGIWSTFEISSDSKYGFFVDNSQLGKIAYADLETMKVIAYFRDASLVYPRSVVINSHEKRLYVGAENGNYVCAIDYTNPLLPVTSQIVLDANPPTSSSRIDPNALLLNKSGNLCFIACCASNEIKVLNTQSGTIVKTLALNACPGTMVFDETQQNLFVACFNDSVSFSGNLGSVQIWNMSAGTLKTLYTGCQPNGMSLNNAYGYLAVVNSNINPKGPKPHHTGACFGRNGYVTYVDLQSLELIPGKKFELAVYPSAIALRQ